MKDRMTEKYINLYHGTTAEFASSIIKSQKFNPSLGGWCGKGVYFYDIKAKAWWSASRTCNNQYIAKPAVVVADLQEIDRASILDLRDPRKLESFASYTEKLLSESDCGWKIAELETDNVDEFEKICGIRALLLNFYCDQHDIKVVIGYFQQQPNNNHIKGDTKKFSDKWLLAIGIETIYCVKDASIIYNIREAGRQIQNGSFV